MAFQLSQIDERLQFFTELLSINESCYLWTYDESGSLLHTNCPDLVLDKFFRNSSCFRYMMEHASQKTGPLLMSSAMGLLWGAVFEQDEGQLCRIHILGPTFTQTANTVELEKAVWGKINPRWKSKYLKIMGRIPVMTYTVMAHRLMMMQYCVTGERIQISDISMQSEAEDPVKEDASSIPDPGIYADRIQVHMAERALLTMIRNGDMNYQTVMQNAGHFFTGKQMYSGNPLQHAKLGQVQFAALCCNAALEGGLTAETAYTRKDAYVQDIDHAKSITEVVKIGRTMYVDYITLVHRQRLNPTYSKPVQSTCDYIENHLKENVSIETLASRVGYSDYYLSRMFKKETGFSIDEYTRNVKIERAKLMLSSTEESIQDIADALGFGGRNYFSVIFRKIVGMPPAAYRKKHQKM